MNDDIEANVPRKQVRHTTVAMDHHRLPSSPSSALVSPAVPRSSTNMVNVFSTESILVQDKEKKPINEVQ